MATGGFQVHDRLGKKLSCDLCDTKVDTCLYKCTDCDVYMCDICTRAHNRVKLTRDHKILKDQHGPLPSYRAESRCTCHPGEDVVFYCHTCVIFICSFCITCNHSNHKCSMIKHASEEMSVELREQVNNLKDNIITVLRSHVNWFKNLQTSNQERHESNVKNIKAHTEILVQSINKIQAKLIQESEKTMNQNELRLSELQNNVETNVEELESKHSDYKNILASGSDIDKIMARNEVLELLEQCQPHVQKVTIYNSIFIPLELDMTSIEKTFGYIEVLEGENVEVNIHGTKPAVHKYTKELSKTMEDVESSQPKLSNIEYVEVKDKKSLKYNPATSEKVNVDSGFEDLTSDKKLSPYEFVTKISNNTTDKKKDSTSPSTSSFDISLNILSQFKHRSTIVRSISSISDTAVYISCYNACSIEQFDSIGQLQGSTKLCFQVKDFVVTSEDDFICTDVKSQNIYTVTKEGKIKEIIYTGPLYPICLCLSSDGYILVTMYDELSYVNQKSKGVVTKMTTTGQTLATYEYDCDKRLFIVPTGIDENINKDICVVNRTSDISGNIVIINDIGRTKCTYKGRGEETFRPVRVKCDKLGHIIVSDFNKKIHILNDSGQFIKFLMSDQDLQHTPFSLGIDTNNTLWIGCHDGQIYIVKYLESSRRDMP